MKQNITEYESTLIQNIEAHLLKVDELIKELKTNSPHIFKIKEKSNNSIPIKTIKNAV